MKNTDMNKLFDTSSLMPISTKPDAVMTRGEGAWLWDHTGKRYLDFVQGWAVNCLGHCPHVVQRALTQQCGALINASPAYYNAPQLQLAAELTRHARLEHAFFCSTGAEANEGAIKLARKWGSLHRNGAHQVITTLGSFHGRTLAMMAASGKPGFAQRFPPAVPGFVHVPYDDVGAVAAAINEQTVAVMVEPIQGEAGVVVPTHGYLRELRALTEQRGILLIADEIQTGMGRTGKLFACEHESVRPDIMTLGKGLGGGLPLAALLARAEISCFAPGDQGSTFGGHPVMCAVGLAVTRALTESGFLEHVESAAQQLSTGLTRIGAQYGASGVRGAGLLWAMRLPRAAGAAVVAAAHRDGLLINSPQPELLRFMPALNVTAEEIDSMLALLSGALQDAL